MHITIARLVSQECSAVVCWHVMLTAEPMGKSEEGAAVNSHTDVPQ